MNRKSIIAWVLSLIVSSMVLLASFSALPSHASVTDDWSTFHHDTMHTGYSTSRTPSTSIIRWSYTTPSGVLSSPAVVDGVVYVGSLDRDIYAFGFPSPPEFTPLVLVFLILAVAAIVSVSLIIYFKKRKH